MTAEVIVLPVIRIDRNPNGVKPCSKKSARINQLENLIAKFNGKSVTRQVELASIMDIKVRTAAQMAGCYPEDFIWGCVVEGLADIEKISSEEFIRKYLSDSGDRTDPPTARKLPEPILK